MNQLEQALDDYSKAIERNPRSSVTHLNIALVYFQTDQYEKGLEAIEKAVEFDSNNPVMISFRGNLFLKLGERDKALKDYEMAIQLKP